MAEKVNHEYFHAKGLLPFQVNFIVNFLEGKDKRIWKLILPTGAGKTRLAAALIAYEMEDGLNKRILVLSPRYSILLQWQSELSFAVPTVTPLIVDRKTYLELESRVPVGEKPWPLPAIILMSIDLAKRYDMAENLSSVIWDLIIFDESHLFSGRQRKALFNRLTKSNTSRRALLLTSIERLPINDLVTRVKIKLSDILDWNGLSLYPSFEKKLTPVYFQRTEEEWNFLKKVEEFTGQIADKLLYGKFLEKNILRAASSSIYTAELLFLRLQDNWKHIRNKIAHNIPLTNEDIERIQQQFSIVTDEPEVIDESYYGTSMNIREFLELFKKLESLLSLIEEVPTDSKLNALISYMHECYKVNDKYHLCIWSPFANTVHYLSSNLQTVENRVYSITSSLKISERIERIDTFRERGGILIITDAISEGLHLPYVDECINYDLPLSTQKFEQRWGRFLRFGRKGEFRMIVLRDKSKTLQWEEELANKILNAHNKKISTLKGSK